MRPEDFDPISLDEAQERWVSGLDFHEVLQRKPSQTTAVDKSIGRVTAAPVHALISAPYYFSAVCDGISVKSADTHRASNRKPLKLKIGKDAYFVDTGGAVPAGFDAVLSIRDVHLQSLEEIVLECPVTPWRNIRPIGEDMTAREIILGENRIITPFDVGALIAGGISEVSVRRKPRIGIIPIGSNLISPGTPPEIGKSIDYRSSMVYHLVEDAHGEPKTLPIIPERIEDIKSVFKKGFERFDLLIVICGPSWGTKLLRKLFLETGELLVGSVAKTPGGDTCLGILDGKPVIALCDAPFALYLGCTLFCTPIINRMLGMEPPHPPSIEAFLGRQIESSRGIDEFLRVNIGEVNDKTVAIPVSRSAAELMSLVRADGILNIPPAIEKLRMGQKVSLQLLSPLRHIKKSILMTGTYDICLDILKNLIENKSPNVSLHSSNTGSAEGLRTLKLGLAHISGIHAFDEKTGIFNTHLIRKILPSTPLVLTNLFRRQIGLLVRNGNPKNILSLDDLARKDVIFVNRQKGSGTRTIMEYHVAGKSLTLSELKLYKCEARTHISLASIIASGLADAGLGILPAAKAFKLDFVPLFLENFDLVIPRSHFNSFGIQVLLEIINSDDFKNDAGTLGGYDLSHAGTITYEQGGYTP